jgi:hypothetical protein
VNTKPELYMCTPSPLAPVPYADDVETLQPDEAEVNAKIAKSFAYIIGKTHEDLGHAERGVHAKSHALLRAQVVVHPDLPPELSQGVFAKARTYQAVVRISSIAGDPLPDTVSLPRGLSVKLFDVDGDRLPGSEGDRTQDFVLATSPVFASATAKQFAGGLELLAATTDRVEWAKVALSTFLRPTEHALEKVGHGVPLFRALGGYPMISPLGDRYWSQAPIRFGDYMAKLDVVPESDNFRVLTNAEFHLDGRKDGIREEVLDLLSREGGNWTLRVQLCRNLETNPIEDASVEWDEAVSPFFPVATIRVEPQESWSEDRSRAVDDQLSFRPWHGISAHRPLGNIMRARREAYPMSVELRGRLNGCPIHEPAMPPID